MEIGIDRSVARTSRCGTIDVRLVSEYKRSLTRLSESRYLRRSALSRSAQVGTIGHS